MKIYLLNETPFEGVENLILNEIVFYDFSVDLSLYDALICTSKNALKALQHAKITLNFKLNLYAVGQSTAQYAKNLGFKKIKIPSKAYGKDLFLEFKEELKMQKCLYLRAKSLNFAHLNLYLNHQFLEFFALKYLQIYYYQTHSLEKYQFHNDLYLMKLNLLAYQ